MFHARTAGCKQDAVATHAHLLGHGGDDLLQGDAPRQVLADLPIADGVRVLGAFLVCHGPGQGRHRRRGAGDLDGGRPCDRPCLDLLNDKVRLNMQPRHVHKRTEAGAGRRCVTIALMLRAADRDADLPSCATGWMAEGPTTRADGLACSIQTSPISRGHRTRMPTRRAAGIDRAQTGESRTSERGGRAQGSLAVC